MSHNVARDLAFSGPTCPSCSELCDRGAVVCHVCKASLVTRKKDRCIFCGSRTWCGYRACPEHRDLLRLDPNEVAA